MTYLAIHFYCICAMKNNFVVIVKTIGPYRIIRPSMADYSL